MVTPIVSNSFLRALEILSGLPRVFPRWVTQPGDEKLEFSCLGVTVIFDMVNLVLRLVISGADDGLRWLDLSRGKSCWAFVVILEILQVDARMIFNAVRTV